jgi:hypothetical protein
LPGQDRPAAPLGRSSNLPARMTLAKKLARLETVP